MKYIVLSVIDGSGMERKWPFIFPEHFIHSDVYETISDMVMNADETDSCVVKAASAGFISSVGINAPTTGKSESLGGLVANPLDGLAIRCIDYTHGIEDAFMMAVLAKAFDDKAGGNG